MAVDRYILEVSDPYGTVTYKWMGALPGKDTTTSQYCAFVSVQ
jgi:hypothetical protein